MRAASDLDSLLLGLMAETYRLQLIRGLERLLASCGFPLVAGVDEVGRGCLAGPVVAAAVILDPETAVPGVDDSKRLATEKRVRVAEVIKRSALAWSVVAVDAAEIDRINVLEATRRAMLNSLNSLHIAPNCALIDAVSLPGLPYPVLPIIRGDSFSYAVASASILAKTERDFLMLEYDREYPEYGFAANKGYGAQEHREALAEIGPTPIHRLTFRSVVPRHSALTGAAG